MGMRFEGAQKEGFDAAIARIPSYVRMLVTACALSLGWAAGVAAQPAQKLPDRPTVTRAFDLIDKVPDRVEVGYRAAFVRKSGARAQQIVQAGLVVRVFSLTEKQDVPAPLKKDGDCDIFISVIHRLVPVAGNEIRFETISSLDGDWLNLSNSLNSVVPGRYFLVFEQSGPGFQAAEQFRLRSADVPNYFATGFKLVVENKSGSIDAMTLRKKFVERTAHLDQLKEDADDKSKATPCFRYSPVNIQSATLEEPGQGELLACLPGVDDSRLL